MKHEFDLRLNSLQAAYQEGTLNPRQLILALRDKATALKPEINLNIHQLSAAE